MRRIGVISDTHGLLRPQALASLAGCDPIIHAGDVGDPAVLQALRRIAPVTAVRGNIDTGGWARTLPETATVEVDGRRIHVLHDLASLDLDPPIAGFHAVISGHSHRPRIAWREGVLYLNPGSAGPRRFKLPVTLGHVTVAKGEVHAQIIELAIG